MYLASFPQPLQDLRRLVEASVICCTAVRYSFAGCLQRDGRSVAVTGLTWTKQDSVCESRWRSSKCDEADTSQQAKRLGVSASRLPSLAARRRMMRLELLHTRSSVHARLHRRAFQPRRSPPNVSRPQDEVSHSYAGLIIPSSILHFDAEARDSSFCSSVPSDWARRSTARKRSTPPSFAQFRSSPPASSSRKLLAHQGELQTCMASALLVYSTAHALRSASLRPDRDAELTLLHSHAQL